MASLVAGTKYRGEFEEKLNRIIKELENNQDIILFIDEIHTMVNAGGAEGAISASDILKPYMARGKIKIIGATTTHEYSKFILKDKALARRLEVINVLEPGYEETIKILNSIKESYEKYYNVNISTDNIKTIVDCTSKYLKNSYNPDKSISMLDLLCAKKSILEYEKKDNNSINKLEIIREKKNSMVQTNNFTKALEYYNIEKKLEMEIDDNKKIELDNKEIKKFIKNHCNIHNLINLDNIQLLDKTLKERIIGQNLAINKIIRSIKNNEKPLSFLLVGPTGVGKKETVKIISDCLNRKLITIDMKEYNNQMTINKLLGGDLGFTGNSEEGEFDKIKYNPSSILLIENIEEASIQVSNLINKILDERIINNYKGEKIDFSYTYIFVTTNDNYNSRVGFIENNKSDDTLFNDFGLKVDSIIRYKSINIKMVKNYLKKKNILNYNIINQYNYKKYGLEKIDKYLKERIQI